MLPLNTRATITGSPRRSVLKVVKFEEFLLGRRDAEDCALWYEPTKPLQASRALSDVKWGAIIAPDYQLSGKTGQIDEGIQSDIEQCVVQECRTQGVVAPGDVIRINQRNHLVTVIHRRAARTNSLLVTERCNSYCLMCSQPPIERDDSQRINELLDVIRLIDPTKETLGITGGEPTLLGADLRKLIMSLKHSLPEAPLHILTNGRRFSDLEFAREIVAAGHDAVMWAIPLYSDSPEIHDYVVQRTGAFKETLQGLLHLAQLKQRIELRMVLQQATIPRLRQFAHFIVRNLTFVDHVAWMGLEPMGFARPNWKELWIDPSEYSSELSDAIHTLDNMRIATSIYNVPLCVLPEHLHRFAAQSISDWKNDYLPECNDCGQKLRCGGFFSSVTREHLPKNIHPLQASPDLAREMTCHL